MKRLIVAMSVLSLFAVFASAASAGIFHRHHSKADPACCAPACAVAAPAVCKPVCPAPKVCAPAKACVPAKCRAPKCCAPAKVCPKPCVAVATCQPACEPQRHRLHRRCRCG